MAKRRASKNDFVGWIERTSICRSGLSAEPGQITLPVYLRAIAAAMADPAVEKITVQKIRAHRVLDLAVVADRLPLHRAAGADFAGAAGRGRRAQCRGRARRYFRHARRRSRAGFRIRRSGDSDRNTILYRKGLAGASLRCVGANAPRNLRAIAAQLVLIDEADALQDTEGDVIALAEARSLTYPAPADHHRRHAAVDRHKPRGALVRGERSTNLRMPVPAVPGVRRATMAALRMDGRRAANRALAVPALRRGGRRRSKPQMVREGRWRALRPEASRTSRLPPQRIGERPAARDMAEARRPMGGGAGRRRAGQGVRATRCSARRGRGSGRHGRIGAWPRPPSRSASMSFRAKYWRSRPASIVRMTGSNARSSAGRRTAPPLCSIIKHLGRPGRRRRLARAR